MGATNVDDLDAREEILHHAIGTLRAQLALIPPDDVRRDALYRDLLWCYRETLALLRARIAARRAEWARQREPPHDPDR
jgi:hypothetical protein